MDALGGVRPWRESLVQGWFGGSRWNLAVGVWLSLTTPSGYNLSLQSLSGGLYPSAPDAVAEDGTAARAEAQPPASV